MKGLIMSEWMAKIGVFFVFLFCFVTTTKGDVQAEPAPGSHIVFLISKDVNNYEAHKTIPRFAKMLHKKHGYETTVLLGKGPRTGYTFPGAEIIKEADVLVVFCRRLALRPKQLSYIRDHLAAGKPLLGIRTANHAFSLRDSINAGFEDWWNFVPDVLGCVNKGYGPVDPGTEVTVSHNNIGHPILGGLPSQWHSDGNVYKVEMVDDRALILLQGSFADHTEPIAWLRTADFGSKIFYTSLGYPKDFSDAYFRTLLLNALQYLLEK